MGELLPSRNRQQGVSGARRRSTLTQPCGCAGGCAPSTKSGDAKGGSYPLSHLYGHFGLVRLGRLGHDVAWTKGQYGEIEAEVTCLIGKVNGRFGDAAWTPIRYVNRSYSRTVLAGIYRAADVAMVTPLRDGMNLAAKEYLAAQDPDRKS